MRITGGTHGGRILQAPKDRAIRPTSDKVRLAIFNMLNARGLVQDAVVLDAFCGTGALGLESLSQGAHASIFMDKSKTSLDLAKRNYETLKMERGDFVLKDATKPGAKPPKMEAANLVFIDPPYGQGLIAPALTALADGGWLANDTHVLMESEISYEPALLSALGYAMILMRDYGDTRIALLQHTQGS